MSPSISTHIEMFIARCFALIGPFGVAILTARLLGPEDRGRYYYVITLSVIAMQVASLGMYASNTYLVAKQPGLLAQLLSNAAWIAIVGGMLFGAGVVVFDIVMVDFRQPLASVAFAIGLSPPTLLFLYLSNLAVGINRPRLFNVMIIFNSLLAIGATAAAAILLPTVNAFLAALIVAGLLNCAVAWACLARGHSIPWAFDWELFSRGLAFALRAHLMGLIAFLMARTATVILRSAGTFDDLGQWSIAAQISDAFLLLPGTVALLLFPTLVRAEDSDRWRQLKSVTLRVGAVMALVCLVAALVARPVITFVFGAIYEPAVGLTLALLPGVFFLSICSMVSQFLAAFGIPWTQIAAWTVGWSLQIALSVVLVQKFGALGLAWVQSLCAALVCVWLLLSALKFSPRRLGSGAQKDDVRG